jgi:hypothetical protein
MAIPLMQRHTQLLRQLVLDSQYAVDSVAVADAIVARATTRRAVMGTVFRNDVRDRGGLRDGGGLRDLDADGLQVRSFRPSRQARSFRPCAPKGGPIAFAPRHRY